MTQNQQGWKEQQPEIVRILERQNAIIDGLKADLDKLAKLWEFQSGVKCDPNCKLDETLFPGVNEALDKLTIIKDGEKFTETEYDILWDYFFFHFAKNNEDEAGAERWIDDLTKEEGLAIIGKESAKDVKELMAEQQRYEDQQELINDEIENQGFKYGEEK
jgi:hypothetical protein